PLPFLSMAARTNGVGDERATDATVSRLGVWWLGVEPVHSQCRCHALSPSSADSYCAAMGCFAHPVQIRPRVAGTSARFLKCGRLDAPSLPLRHLSRHPVNPCFDFLGV